MSSLKVVAIDFDYHPVFSRLDACFATLSEHPWKHPDRFVQCLVTTSAGKQCKRYPKTYLKAPGAGKAALDKISTYTEFARNAALDELVVKLIEGLLCSQHLVTARSKYESIEVIEADAGDDNDDDDSVHSLVESDIFDVEDEDQEPSTAATTPASTPPPDEPTRCLETRGDRRLPRSVTPTPSEKQPRKRRSSGNTLGLEGDGVQLNLVYRPKSPAAKPLAASPKPEKVIGELHPQLSERKGRGRPRTPTPKQKPSPNPPRQRFLSPGAADCQGSQSGQRPKSPASPCGQRPRSQQGPRNGTPTIHNPLFGDLVTAKTPRFKDALRRTIIKDLTARERKEGSVYVFRKMSDATYYKVGWTRVSVAGRMKDKRHCAAVDSVLIYPVPGSSNGAGGEGREEEKAFRGAMRVEALVHRDLGHRNRRVRKCPHCGGKTEHKEWFEVTEEEVVRCVRFWTRFVRAGAYDAEGRLAGVYADIMGQAAVFDKTLVTMGMVLTEAERSALWVGDEGRREESPSMSGDDGGDGSVELVRDMVERFYSPELAVIRGEAAGLLRGGEERVERGFVQKLRETHTSFVEIWWSGSGAREDAPPP